MAAGAEQGGKYTVSGLGAKHWAGAARRRDTGNKGITMKRITTVMIAALFVLPAVAEPPVVYVVRHAEKLDGSDPGLSEQGRRRADRLATLLADAGITRIFSTATRRTRETVAPLAAQLGLEVEIYDHREQEQLAARLREQAETVLVVGHSNTIAGFVTELGADAGSPVNEDEYDRLYAVTLAPLAATLRRYTVE